MRGGAETVRIAAVWADTTRPYPVGQEGVQAMVDISFRVAHEPETTPFLDTSAFPRTYGLWMQQKTGREQSSISSCGTNKRRFEQL
jgi:hypothetical protein